MDSNESLPSQPKTPSAMDIDRGRLPAYPPSRTDEQPSSFSRIPVSDTRTGGADTRIQDPREPSPAPDLELRLQLPRQPSPALGPGRGPTTPGSTSTHALAGSSQPPVVGEVYNPYLPKKKRKLGPPVVEGTPTGTPTAKNDLDVPVDPVAIAKANLKAAPIVGVVGYGPGTGGGSGIKRHTPSCDFCKRQSLPH